MSGLDARIHRLICAPEPGALAARWREDGARVIVGHPTFHNAPTIGRLVRDDLRSAAATFAGAPVAVIVTDGSESGSRPDPATLDAALAGARQGLAEIDPEQRARVSITLTPYEGYGGDHTPGKGSALKLVFDEAHAAGAELLILADGDLRNEMGQWQRVYAAVEAAHRQRHGERPMFITARYARHFVDASLTRFVVGPLTTLLGRYVPGGISGDIALSAGAVAKEHAATWTDARRRYGTDISTTFDNLADPATVVYEVWLGAKLHDITDEARLAVMPGQVIGAALERIVHWEQAGGLVSAAMSGERPLQRAVTWGPRETGVGFVDPGATGVFDVDHKAEALIARFGEYRAALLTVYGPDRVRALEARLADLDQRRRDGRSAVTFLGVGAAEWIELLGVGVVHTLWSGEVEDAARALSYLYTAAFLEFVGARLTDLGHDSVDAVRRAQATLAVPADQAEAFYRERVDGFADALAARFFAQMRTSCSLSRPERARACP
jgi:hypothetical protein